MLKSQLVEGQVSFENSRIFYVQAGSPSALTPILFLHGWGISVQPYYEVLELLAQQHPVIAPGLPNSSRSSSYSPSTSCYSDYAETILAFLEAIAIPKVHLVGHSLGGGIALTLAAIAPEKVQSLVLVDSTGIPSGSVLEVLARRAVEMPAQISLAKLKLQWVDIPRIFALNCLFNTNNVIQALLLSLRADLRPLLPQIKAPCLVLWSEKDLTTPFTAAQEFSQKISGAQLVAVEEGFHEWSLVHPEKFAAIVSKFLSQRDP